MDKNWKELTITRLRCFPNEYLLNGLTITECVKEIENETDFGLTLVNATKTYLQSLKHGLKI